jgi:hypothetical protein
MIKPEQYTQFLNSVANDLDGDWLVIGGSLLAIIQSENRATVYCISSGIFKIIIP